MILGNMYIEGITSLILKLQWRLQFNSFAHFLFCKCSSESKCHFSREGTSFKLFFVWSAVNWSVSCIVSYKHQSCWCIYMHIPSCKWLFFFYDISLYSRLGMFASSYNFAMEKRVCCNFYVIDYFWSPGLFCLWSSLNQHVRSTLV